MPTSPPDALKKIKRFDQLIAYLRDELDWPIETDDFDDLTFDYEPEELGIDPKNAAKIDKGSDEPNRTKVGTVTDAQLAEIAEIKKQDLNSYDVEAAKKIIAGTARSMGLEVEG